MKLCLFLLIALLVAFVPRAYSQTPDQTPQSKFEGAATLGKIFGRKKAPPPTPEQIDESLVVYDQCKGSEMHNQYYNCDCLSADFLQSRTENPKEAQYTLVLKSRKKCGNSTNIAGLSYERCLSWAPRLKNNYEQYCSCYANSFARSFVKSPTDSIRGREILMTNALNGCNTGTELAERQARQNMINLLKKQGIYETLFPGAKKDPAEEQE